MKVICNSDCRHTSLEEGECQRESVLMIWIEREEVSHKGKPFPDVVCDDYEPIRKETK